MQKPQIVVNFVAFCIEMIQICIDKIVGIKV